MASLLEFIGGAVIVGHNIRFDMSFLNAAALQLGYGRLGNRTADTVALARRLIQDEVRNLKLATLAAHYRSPVKPNHRALEDAKATAHVFFELLERAGTVGAVYLEDLLRLPTAKGRPHYDKISLTDRLPRRPGVYMFRDTSGAVIYVGKAKNLRTRSAPTSTATSGGLSPPCCATSRRSIIRCAPLSSKRRLPSYDSSIPWRLDTTESPALQRQPTGSS